MKKFLLSLLIGLYSLNQSEAQDNVYQYLYKVSQDQYDWVIQHPNKDLPQAYYSQLVDSSRVNTLYDNEKLDRGYYFWLRLSYPSNEHRFFQIIDYHTESVPYSIDTFALKVFDERSEKYASQITAKLGKKDLVVEEGLVLIPYSLLSKKRKVAELQMGSSSLKVNLRVVKNRLESRSWYYSENNHFILLDKQNYLVNDSIRFAGFLTRKMKPEKVKEIYAQWGFKYRAVKSLGKTDLVLRSDGSYSGSIHVKEHYFQYDHPVLEIKYKRGKHWFSQQIDLPLKEYQKENYVFDSHFTGTSEEEPALKITARHQSGRAATEVKFHYAVLAKPNSIYDYSGNFSFKDTIASGIAHVNLAGEFKVGLDFEKYPKGNYNLNALVSFYVPGEKEQKKHPSSYFFWSNKVYDLTLSNAGILEIKKYKASKESVKLIAHYSDHSDTLLSTSEAYSMPMQKGVKSYQILGSETDITQHVAEITFTDYEFIRDGDSIYLSWKLAPHDICSLCLLKNSKPVFCSDSRNVDTVIKASTKKEWVLRIDRKGHFNTRTNYASLTVKSKSILIDFDVPKEVVPGTQLQIRGKVVDENGKIVPNAHLSAVAINESVPGYLRYRELSAKKAHYKSKYKYPEIKRYVHTQREIFWKKIGKNDSLVHRHKLGYSPRVYDVLSNTSTRTLEYEKPEFVMGGSFDVIFIKNGLYYRPNYLKLSGHFYSLIGNPWAEANGHQELKPGLYELEAGLAKKRVNLILGIKKGIHQVLIINLDESQERGIEVSRRRRRFNRAERTSLKEDFMFIHDRSGAKTIIGNFLGTNIQFKTGATGNYYGPFDEKSRINYILHNYHSMNFGFESKSGVSLSANKIRFFQNYFASRKIKRNLNKESEAHLTNAVYSRPKTIECFTDFPRFSNYPSGLQTNTLVVSSDSTIEWMILKNKSDGSYHYTRSKNVKLVPGNYELIAFDGTDFYLADSFEMREGINLLRKVKLDKKLTSTLEYLIPYKANRATYNADSTYSKNKALEFYVREGEGNCPVSQALVRLISPGEELLLKTDDEGYFHMKNPPSGSFVIHIQQGDRNWVSEGKLILNGHLFTQVLIALDSSESFYLYDIGKYQGAWYASRFSEPFGNTYTYPISKFKSKFYYKDFKVKKYRRSRRFISIIPGCRNRSSFRYRALSSPSFGGSDDFYSGWAYGDGNLQMEVTNIAAKRIYGTTTNIGYLEIGSQGFAAENNDLSAFRANSYSLAGSYNVKTEESLDVNRLRENFKDQGLWLPNLTSDDKGEFSFDFKVPDDLTTWELHVFAMTPEADYAHKAKEIKSSKAFQTNILGPTYLRLHDTSCFTLLFNHEDSTEKELTWKLQTGVKEYGRTQKMNSFLSLSHCSVAKYKELYLILKGTTQEDKDGLQKAIPVKRIGSDYKTVRWVHVKNGVDTLIRPNLPSPNMQYKQLTGVKELMEQISDDLIDYKYDCNEQLASKYLAYLFKKNKSLLDKYRMGKIEDQLIKNQNSDGGWSWWNKGVSKAWVSGYVYFVLSQNYDYDYTRTRCTKRAETYLNLTHSDEHDLWNQCINRTSEGLSKDVKSPSEQLKQFATAYHLFNNTLYYDSSFIKNLIEKEGYLSKGINSKIERLRWNALLAQIVAEDPQYSRERLLNWFLAQLQGELTTLEKSFVLVGINALTEGEEQDAKQGEAIFNKSSKGLGVKSTNGSSLIQITETFFDSTDTYSQGQGVNMKLSLMDSLPIHQKETVKLRVSIQLDQPMEYCLLEIPMAAGLLLKGISRIPDTEFQVSFRDKYQVAFSQLPAGETIIEIECEGVFAGNYYQAPCKLFPMYSPGNTAVSPIPARIKILED